MAAPTEIEIRPKRRGNYVPGKGRVRGSKNRKTLALEAAVLDAQVRLSEALPDLQQMDAHTFLQMCYRSPNLPLLLRMEAAGKALRFEKPALSYGALDASVGSLRATLAQRLDAAMARAGALLEGAAFATPTPSLPANHTPLAAPDSAQEG